MKDSCLYDFFGIIDRSDVILKNNGSIIEFKTFNEQDVIDKYKLFIVNKRRVAILEQMSKASKCRKDFYQHMKPLISLLNESLSFFKMKYGLLTHDRLSFTDTDGHPYLLSEIPFKVKETIAAFLQVQSDAIIDFLSVIEPKEITYKLPDEEKIKNSNTSVTTNIETQKPNSGKKIPEIKFVLGEQLLDTEDICTLLNYTPRAIQNLRNKELLPFTIIGNKFLIQIEYFFNIHIKSLLV